MESFSFEAIGTQWHITTEVPVDTAVRSEVAALVEQYDAALSRFRPDSAVTTLGHSGGTAILPGYAAPLLDLFDSLERLTQGRLNPLVGGSLEQLGYGPGYPLRPLGPPAAAPGWTSTVSWQRQEAVETVALTLNQPATVDVGAAGKGQLVDLVWELLTARGYAAVVVDAGSDMRHSGPESLRVALEHPYDPGAAIGVLDLQDGALCASAANRRSWGEGLHHVLDASTGRPVDAVAATWVLAADAMTADGLATALFITDPALLAAEFSFEYVRMFSDGRAQFSNAMAGVLFS
ncbi:FAD:protein FMN transferase [Arthrobacter sp. Sa2CUA1]|uniref:FAD:protein FMN transferase n=1 Tax=Arthrobacter gallicola TaxID=2762225 RepID=A0ABR8USU6_9MICC|nr:FAD:protein FMN transferase [Arthrobacter gallicola]MBD7995460.1 FAD:protein FMN transferase [Arthrobacter gallicola]